MLETEMASADEIKHRTNELWDAQAYEEVEQIARAGLARFPEDRGLRTTYGYSLLGQGRYREGFRELEVRDHRLNTPPRTLSYPEWSGPIAGRSILVWGEQGIGDEIQTARFVRDLRAAGASRITLACTPLAVRAFADVGADLVVSRLGTVSIPKHDCWVSAWSIPYRLGTTLSDLSGEPYLNAEPRARGGVGLVERGNPKNPRDTERSMPEGLLQRAIPEGRLLPVAGDLYDSLCEIAGLDLLITVDTSWAHMAGALGVPCWVLLPYRLLDWRWLRERADTPWYHSIRLFRQRTPGDWEAVVADVAAQLRSG